MIDIRKLKELVRLMVVNDLTELDLRDTEEQVTLRRPGGQVLAPVAPATPAVAVASPPPQAIPADATVVAEAEPELLRIESPMVGTFYAKPSPDADDFVQVGTRVDPDTVLCLVEAMKIFNEIKAECTGTIRKMLVRNTDPIEFGQLLFLIKPD
jgi:acetyl-CoA carboxylase biotin carboxyl carrier protein